MPRTPTGAPRGNRTGRGAFQAGNRVQSQRRAPGDKGLLADMETAYTTAKPKGVREAPGLAAMRKLFQDDPKGFILMYSRLRVGAAAAAGDEVAAAGPNEQRAAELADQVLRDIEATMAQG